MNEVKKFLKERHSIVEYEEVIEKLKRESNNDTEILAYMANDKMMSPEIRLFATVVMEELRG